MPDLVTHAAFSMLLRRPLEAAGRVSTSRPDRVLFYLGTILPDIMTRPFFILFPSLYTLVLPFHTPAGMLCVCAVLALLFAEKLRKRAFFNLTAGAFVHFLLDSFQIQVNGSDFWLFPFSWREFGVELFHAYDLMRLLPLQLALIAVMELIIARQRRKRG